MPKLTVAFWNVANLFEPLAVVRGPQSHEELNARVNRLAEAINGLDGSGRSPDILGLAEVGTERILKLLLARLQGQFIYDWCEPRNPEFTGLAVIARTELVSDLARVAEYRPTMYARPRCLVLSVSLAGKEEPVLFAIVHFKSRMPSELNDKDDRLFTARWLGDLLAKQEKRTCAVVIGDFNAEPFESPFNDVSLRASRTFSGALWTRATPAHLYNTAWRFLAEPEFWEHTQIGGYQQSRPATTFDCSPPVIFDQLLVSARALKGGPIRLQEQSVQYPCRPPLGTVNRNGKHSPDRWQYESPGNYTGVSDHFPLFAVFNF
jgi:endonuclease/exonuclease/phosphatase family metal-dependent hydrolase